MGSYRTELFDRFSIQSARSRSEPDDRIDYQASQRIGEEAIYAWIYPNLMVNRYGPCLDSNLVVPLGPDRCRVDYEFYFAKSQGEGEDSFAEESMEQADVTQGEDMEICESVQTGLQSSAYDRGRYAPTVEMGEHHFHCLLASDLRDSDSTRS
jgi:choline monooxygenase